MSIHESLAIILDWMRNHAPSVLEELNPPASAAEIARVESALGLPLPPLLQRIPQSAQWRIWYGRGTTWRWQ